MTDLEEEGIATLKLDVTSAMDIKSAVDKILATTGHIDLLVCNAGNVNELNTLSCSLLPSDEGQVKLPHGSPSQFNGPPPLNGRGVILIASHQLATVAGMTAPGFLAEMDYKNVERVFNVNVHGVFRTVQVSCNPSKGLHLMASIPQASVSPVAQSCQTVFIHVMCHTGSRPSHDGPAQRQDSHPLQRQLLLSPAFQCSLCCKPAC